MTTLICAIVSNDPINFDALEDAYEKVAGVPAVWVDLGADIKRPVCRARVTTRARWFSEMLPELVATGNRRGDLDIILCGPLSAKEKRAIVWDFGGSVFRVSRGTDPVRFARKLAEELAA